MPTFTPEQIKDVAETLDMGLCLYYHKNRGKFLKVPRDDGYMDASEWETELEELENNFQDYYEVRGRKSNESFKVMEAFAEQLTNVKLKDELLRALDRKKPFSGFKFIIDNSGKHRQEWFDFRDKANYEWAEEQLNYLNQRLAENNTA